jgi:hypothetical protein
VLGDLNTLLLYISYNTMGCIPSTHDSKQSLPFPPPSPQSSIESTPSFDGDPSAYADDLLPDEINDEDAEESTPIYVLPYSVFKTQTEMGRLGIGPAQREELGLTPNEMITDKEIRKHCVQNISNLFVQVGDQFTPASEALVDISTFNRLESIIILVSHCWLCGYAGAKGY